MQRRDDDRGDQADPAEINPTAALEPRAQPLERDEPRDESENTPEDTQPDVRMELGGREGRSVLAQAQRLTHNDGWRKDHGEREAEGLSRSLLDAHEHARGNGRARAGEAAERERQALYDADHRGLRNRRLSVLRSLASLVSVGNDDQYAHEEEGRGDQLEMAE